MNITKSYADALNITLCIKIDESDYQDAVIKKLKDYRRSMQMPGFRPGNVPMEMVQKIYGKSIVYDEVLKLLDDSVNVYLEENHLRTLGDPVPSKDMPVQNFEMQHNFEFIYDLALRPDVILHPADIEIVFYNVTPTDDFVKKSLFNKQRMYGKIIDISNDDADDFLIYVDASQNAEGGIKVENGLLSSSMMSNEQKKKFGCIKQNETIHVNIRELMPNDIDCAAFLNIKKDKLASVDAEFVITIKKKCRIEPAELNQDFFDKIFGTGRVNSEEECLKMIENDIAAEFTRYSNDLFAKTLRNKLIEQAEIILPEDTLRRWLQLKEQNKEQSEKSEQVNNVQNIDEEVDFDKKTLDFFATLRWSLVVEEIAAQNSIEVTENDIVEYVRATTLQSLAWYYDLSQIDNEVLESHIGKKLNDNDYRRRAAEHILVSNVIKMLKGIVKLEVRNVTDAEFDKILGKNED